MSGTTNDVRDRRAERHDATRAEIVAAAWELARDHGLGDISLRDLAGRVGMKAQSIYSYFDSKDAIYDAMFAEGARAFLERSRDAFERRSDSDDLFEVLRDRAEGFTRFCTDDPVRYQLLFQRPIPGFEPSAEAYAPAVEALDLLHQRMTRHGLDDPAVVDLWTALLAGLTDQQISNDPGGDRWLRLVDRAVQMFVDHVTKGS